MASNKKQHYVPKCYLKRFSADGTNIYVYVNNQVAKIPYKNQNQENYLYSLNRKIFKDSFNLVENYLGKNVEDKYNRTLLTTIDQGIIPKSDEFFDIVNFALVQSCRSLLNKNIYKDSLENMGINQTNNPLFSFGMIVLSHIKSLIEKMKTCSIELAENPTDKDFITSDHPASYWIDNNGQIIHVTPPETNIPSIKNHPSLYVLMSISPKFLLKVFLNVNRPAGQESWNINHIIINEDKLNSLNAQIEYAKHEKIFSNSDIELK